MPRTARFVLPGVAHHITQRGTDGQRVFWTGGDHRVYLELLSERCRHTGLRALAYCLMPNHVHLVAVPEEADALATVLRRTHGRYAQYANARRRRTGHLWQNRFFSCPLDEPHLWTALGYVERNPVRAQLSALPAQYVWSSAAAHLSGVDSTSVLDMSWWQEQGGRDRWHTLLATPDELIAVRMLKRHTYTGRPLGGQVFLDQVTALTGRPMTSGVRAYVRQKSAAAAMNGFNHLG